MFQQTIYTGYLTMLELTAIDRLIEELCARRDPESLVEVQEALINRANALESALWALYRQTA